MTTYWFGKGHDRYKVVALHLEHAIKQFKVECLFPEKYVDNKYVKETEYNDAFHRYDYTFRKDPKISIFEDSGRGSLRDKKVGEIALAECLNVRFEDLLPQKLLLTAPVGTETPTEGESKTLPVIGRVDQIQTMDKGRLRTMHDMIKAKQNELEYARQQLNEAMSVLHKELSEKLKALYAIEVFMGIREEIYQLSTGERATDEVPLSLFQDVLYMDEELGVWEEDGIDVNNIEVFDEWITKHFEMFMPTEKCVRTFQVRREEKDYGDPWINHAMNIENTKTYFLIRNGQCLWRIWSDVRIPGKLLPGRNEYADLIKKESKWSEEQAEEELQELHQSYLYGLIAIQGLIERTDVFGYSLRGKVNLMKGEIGDLVHIVYDGESEYWISDNKHLTWKDFIKQNRETITQGTRIVMTCRDHFDFWKDDHWRVSPFRPSNGPSHYITYVVESEEKDRKYGDVFKILYQPGDKVEQFDRWGNYTGHAERKNRVSFQLFRKEAINFDKITIEECEYYERNRWERKDYLRILPILHWVKAVKRTELKLDIEFAKLVTGQLGWTEDRIPDVIETAKWWRTKNKWKRGLESDDALALRMVVRKLKGQADDTQNSTEANPEGNSQ